MSKYTISEIGEFNYPWLNKPDTKYNDDGLYHVKLVLEGKSADAMAAKIEEACQDAFDKHVNDPSKVKKGQIKNWKLYKPFQDVEDDDTGEPTGETAFTFKQNAKIKLKDGSEKDVTIQIRDAKDNIVDVFVRGGSMGRIMYKMRPIVMAKDKMVGVRLDFFKVQVTKMAQADTGFGAVDGGYDGSEDSSAPEGEEEEGNY